jgi:hypothetical protein
MVPGNEPVESLHDSLSTGHFLPHVRSLLVIGTRKRWAEVFFALSASSDEIVFKATKIANGLVAGF